MEEILHELIGRLSHYLQGFIYILAGDRRIFEASTAVLLSYLRFYQAFWAKKLTGLVGLVILRWYARQRSGSVGHSDLPWVFAYKKSRQAWKIGGEKT